MKIIIIIIILLIIKIYRTLTLDTFAIEKQAYTHQDYNIPGGNMLKVGEYDINHPYRYDLEVQNKLLTNELCLFKDTNSASELCLNTDDFKTIKNTPHHYPDGYTLKIGNETIKEKELLDMVNVDKIIQKYYIVPSKKASLLALPRSNHRHWLLYGPGDGGRGDDYFYWNYLGGYLGYHKKTGDRTNWAYDHSTRRFYDVNATDIRGGGFWTKLQYYF